MVSNEALRLAFAERLKEALVSAGQPLRGAPVRLHEITGVSPNAATKWLKGESLPSPAHLMLVCEWLDVREEWLFFGKGAKGPFKAASYSKSERDESKRPQSTVKEAPGSSLLNSLERLQGTVTPRSREILMRIAQATQEGKLTEDDLLLLGRVAKRFEHHDNDKAP